MSPPPPPARASDTADVRPGLGETVARLLLTRSPLGALVRRVARIRASVHAKLLGAFLLIAVLLIAIAATSVQTIRGVVRHSRQLEQARERVDSSRRIEQAVAVQISMTRNALVLRDEVTIQGLLSVNNRFTDSLRRLEGGASATERDAIDRIRAAEDRMLTTGAQIARLIADGKADEALAL